MGSGGYPSRASQRMHKNLAARARPTRTFGGLLTFTALLFLSCGVYLVSRPLIDPVAAHEAGMLAGAFAIALASILLFYLAKSAIPRRQEQGEPRPERMARVEEQATRTKSLALERCR